MELTYPINLVGIENGKASGDVVTRYGEFLGIWRLREDDKTETGEISFIVDGETEPTFTEGIGILDSGMLTGLAMSNICRAIDDWHEARGKG